MPHSLEALIVGNIRCRAYGVPHNIAKYRFGVRQPCCRFSHRPARLYILRGSISNFLEHWQPNQLRLLFAARSGTPWDQNLLLKPKFRTLLRALAIQLPSGNGFHAFRHANATLMNSFGASQKLRQQRLGHADGPPVTETIYTHVISEDGKRIAAQLGNAVWGVLDASWTLKQNGSRVESPKPFVIN